VLKEGLVHGTPCPLRGCHGLRRSLNLELIHDTWKFELDAPANVFARIAGMRGKSGCAINELSAYIASLTII
jgi:hypothetical protein